MNIILSVFSGIVLTSTFPTILYPLAYVALIPFLIAIDRARDKKEAFFSGIAFGVVFYGGVFFFVNTLTDWVGGLIFLGFAGLALFLSLYTGLFAWLLKILTPKLNLWERIVAAPLLWIFIEWLRSLGPYGLVPSIGYSQWIALPIIQIAQATGVAGIAFLVVLCNVAFKEMMFAKKLRVRLYIFLIPLIAITITVLFGIYELNIPLKLGQSKKVVVVQGNHSQKQKMNSDMLPSIKKTYLELSASSKIYKPDIVLWPETAIPYYIQKEPFFISRLCHLIRDIDAIFVIGTPRLDIEHRAYNSAAFFSADGRFLGWQDKYNLVPFGEYLPARSFLVPLLDYLGQSLYTQFLVRDFSSSEYRIPVETGSGKIGLGICIDSFFPKTMRRYVLQGADYLFVITNDAWFKRSSAIFKHTVAGVFRAIENRRYVVQAANNGISSVIDPYGQIITKSGFWERTVLAGEIKEVRNVTFYTKFGDVFTYFCLLGLLALVLIKKPWKRKF